MKKLLAMLLVMVLGAAANGAVLEVVAYDVGQSEGRTGTADNWLLVSDVLGVKIVVGHNPYAGYPSYDGYLVSSVDLDLHVVGPGSLSVETSKTGDPLVQTDLDSLIVDMPVNGDVPRMQGISLAGVGPGSIIVDGLLYHHEAAGPALLDLTLLGLTEYSPYQTAIGNPYPGGWLAATEDDLGDRTIYEVPEPLTMVLLGIGGVGLWRRRG